MKKQKLIVAMLCGYATYAAAGNATQEVETPVVDVVGLTPLQSSGTPINDVPANVQVVTGADLKNQQSISIGEYMQNNLAGVNVNESANNPFMGEVNFHGFTASPLLGQPQGLSVYLDGVRVNQAFGETVNWDLIPTMSIAGIELIPGSNPLFGLNTLGGALAIQTKSGDLYPGGSVEVTGGSWGRRAAQAEYGGSASNGFNYYVSGNIFHEDGWRQESSTDVRQIFTKLGWKGDRNDFNVSINLANNDLNGNGYTPESMLAVDRSLAYTWTDNTKNKQNAVTGQFNHWFSDELVFNSLAYYRNVRTNTAGVDIADGVDDPSWDGNEGQVNYSTNDQDAYGVGGQLNWITERNQLVAGASYDYSVSDYTQGSSEFASFSDGGVGSPLLPYTQNTSLHGTSKTWSIFATDGYKLIPDLTLTLSGRFNHTEVNNSDNLIAAGTAGSLTSNSTFQRFNPAVGLTYNVTSNLNIFGGYNEGSRAPSSIELGCSDPDHPCQLANAMQGDPPLKQVVSKTFEGGVRGTLGSSVKWSVAAYRTENSNDLQFITDTDPAHLGQGWFQNVGETLRQGVDVSLNSKLGALRWMVGYSFVDATYQSTFNVNSSSSVADATTGQITVHPGDRITGIPQHQLKLRAEYDVLSNWVVGLTATAFSDQYMRGDENNEDPTGKLPGYITFNLDTRYNIGTSGWQAFAKVNNLFDQNYYTSGLFATNNCTVGCSGVNPSTFDANGTTERFLAPGAPRAAWVGLRYDFGGNTSKGAAAD